MMNRVSVAAEGSNLRMEQFMAEHANTALVRRAVESIWNNGALADADILFADDYVNHGGLIPDLLQGPEVIKVSVAMYRAAFPGLQIRVDGLTAQRDAVLLRWTAQSNRMVGSLTGLLVSRVANGTIAESWTAWDQAGVLERYSHFHAPTLDTPPISPPPGGPIR